MVRKGGKGVECSHQFFTPIPLSLPLCALFALGATNMGEGESVCLHLGEGRQGQGRGASEKGQTLTCWLDSCIGILYLSFALTTHHFLVKDRKGRNRVCRQTGVWCGGVVCIHDWHRGQLKPEGNQGKEVRKKIKNGCPANGQ